jgi:type IV pilus assembly protein PilX
MIFPSTKPEARQRGMVLVTALLLLLVVTIIAVTMFHSFGTQERIASNTREKQRALHAAESAQQYAEWWLSMGNGNAITTCTALVPASQAQVCQNKLTDLYPNSNVAANLPWMNGKVEVGVSYAPPDMNVTTTVGANTYIKSPSFYISYLGLADGGASSVYQIDAVGDGGRADAVAVVESTYKVTTAVKCLSCGP